MMDFVQVGPCIIINSTIHDNSYVVKCIAYVVPYISLFKLWHYPFGVQKAIVTVLYVAT
jgi:hypothetical protein